MYTPRLKVKYKQEIVPHLQKELGYKSPMAVPQLQAIYINQGLARVKDNRKIIENAQENLTLIAGQKAVLTKAKNAISNFKLRAGMVVGARVTLRGDKMWEFVDRLFTLNLARVRDFRGVKPNAFDKQGNYTLGLKEQIIFPELNIDKVDKITGLNITFVTTAKEKKTSYALLRALGMPFADMHKK